MCFSHTCSHIQNSQKSDSEDEKLFSIHFRASPIEGGHVAHPLNPSQELIWYPVVMGLIQIRNIPYYLYRDSFGKYPYSWVKMTSKPDIHIWNANRPMKCEAKKALYGGQFCTSVSVSDVGLFISFSLPLFTFSEEFSFKIHTKHVLKDRNEFKNFKYFDEVKPSYGCIFSR